MSEKTIIVSEMDPIEIFGANNAVINRLCRYFPSLQIVIRGDLIKLRGGEEDMAQFQSKFDELVKIRYKKRNLTPADVDEMFGDEADAGKDSHSESMSDIILHAHEGRIIRARTENQKRLLQAYPKNDMMFVLGPAGTGKTYTAIALAVRALKNREVKRIILTRPAVEAGERLGFLPGDLKEKLDPYLQPLYDALIDMIPASKLKAYHEEGTIQIAPLAYMRGRTLDNAFVILDEAQNTTISQMKMFLTRMGCNAKFIITGDATQIDLPSNQQSGLLRTIDIVKDIEGISVIQMTKKDIVRHKLVEKIVQRFAEHKLDEPEQDRPAPHRDTDR